VTGETDGARHDAAMARIGGKGHCRRIGWMDVGLQCSGEDSDCGGEECSELRVASCELRVAPRLAGYRAEP
jgi:hypothetical protein